MNGNQLRARIRTSLANQHLQKALDINAERRVTKRLNALESLPDWRERRQQAHAIRANIIEHLDQYLDQFTTAAQANGVTVHRAKDATEAVQIVLKIAKDSPQREKEKTFVPHSDLRGKQVLIAKSKSMVSEEINLNHALENENIQVVETDLGEYIVQLRGEKPSHIITPALHLRRQDVGQLFHEKLGIAYTEDIPTLTNTARNVLREVFLTADIGVSGANFIVAETGSVCLVTNEGNGRMVTTLPPVHIALIGMERLVRNFDELALMLSLLPRSATGQKLSVYTQIVSQPLPHQQRHFIILDNGRSRLRNSPLKESLYCIRCGSCLNACPVFREIGGHAYHTIYPGPIGSVISAGLFGSEFVPLAQASSLCGACKDACPVDIDLPKLLTRVRAGASPSPIGRGARGGGENGLSSMSKIFLKTYTRLATHPRLFALSQKFAALTTSLLAPFSEYLHLPAFTGWGYSKDLPKFAGKSFRESFLESDSLLSETTDTPADKRAGAPADTATNPPEHQTSTPSLVSQFTDELIKVHGNVLRTSQNEVTDKVIEFLSSRGINQIHLEPNVLHESKLTQAGISVSHARDAALGVGVTPHVPKNRKETCGVTKALCGLADTGSVLEADGDGDKLYASLLPEIHLVILRAVDIYPTLGSALHHVRNRASAVFITGPSATGDIESVHTLGVHGPGEIHVFLVDD